MSPRVLVVGSGWRFTSGISYYTCRLTNALAEVGPTSAILMRQLVPSIFYPGRDRVGRTVNDLTYSADVEVFDGVDWYWGPSAVGAFRFLRQQSPDVVVLQWWTGAVLHSYAALAGAARRRGARVVMEWHEVQDSGEARIPGVVRYTRAAMQVLLRSVDAHVVHSRFDAELLQDAYGLSVDDVTTIPHGPYDHVLSPEMRRGTPERRPATVEEPLRLLFFGTIRPYKGLEDLVAAYDALPPETAERIRLTIVGETWEGWDAPLLAAARSRYSARIDVVNRYVSDAEVSEHFARADAVALPYRRSSSSGPLHIAMSAGLPVVVSSVGGLVEAARDYTGATFVTPGDVQGLANGLAALTEGVGARHEDPHSWDASVAAYQAIFTRFGGSPGHVSTAPVDPQPATPHRTP